MIMNGFAMEDLTVNHNTEYNNIGGGPSFLFTQQNPWGGVVFTNNIGFYTGSYPAIGNGGAVPDNMGGVCTGDYDVALMNCGFTPSYTFSKNVVVPSWNDSSQNYTTGNFVGTATVNTAFTGLTSTNFIPAGASQAANVALVNWLGACAAGAVLQCALSISSPYHRAALDSTDIGVNIVVLQAAQSGSGGGVALSGPVILSGKVRFQ